MKKSFKYNGDDIYWNILLNQKHLANFQCFQMQIGLSYFHSFYREGGDDALGKEPNLSEISNASPPPSTYLHLAGRG